MTDVHETKQCGSKVGVPGWYRFAGAAMVAGLTVLVLAFLIQPGWSAGLRIRDQEIVQTVRLKVGQSKVLRTP
ncbi:MAG: hypothetical protein JRI59_11800, partial [Deltaproteobacteria bacterium]|nr:hypothetical protein [Deltaproteobacteria bacterium]